MKKKKNRRRKKSHSFWRAHIEVRRGQAWSRKA